MRWATLRDIPRIAVLLDRAFPGPRWRHFVKAAAVPHLVVAGHPVVLGVAPDDGTRSYRGRIVNCSLNVTWLLAAFMHPPLGDQLPWGLCVRRNLRWRLVNLTRGADSPGAAILTLTLCRTAIDIADSAGIEIEAAVDLGQPRLAKVYRRYGFSDTELGPGSALIMRKPPAPGRAKDDSWRRVLRTGRVSGKSLCDRFGNIAGPVLDAGAGDSRMTKDLLEQGVLAVALDPAFGIRGPQLRHGAAVAGVMERLPFASAAFATVHASYSLQHSPHPARAFDELLRVTRHDGVVLIHPCWGSALTRRAVRAIPGVSVLPGHALPFRRQRLSIRIACADFDGGADLRPLIRSLQPAAPVRALGVLAMRLMIRAHGTTSVGPGATR